MNYNILDLFCGAGGFSLGFEMAGFNTVLALDKFEAAINTFNYNRKSNVAVNMDIYDYTDSMLQELMEDTPVTGIIGGPPCQGFSMSGLRDKDDCRNQLYLQYVRFVEVLKPDFFVLENVEGLLSLNKGLFKEDILSRFSELGYNVTYKVLLASDYSVPQNRRRVFFVGLKRDVFSDTFFEFPEGSSDKISCSMALSDLPNLDNGEDPTVYRTEPLNEYQEFMRLNCDKLYNNEKRNHTQRTVEVIKMVPEGKCMNDLPDSFFEKYGYKRYRQSFNRMDSTKPSMTIDTGHGSYFHYKENRTPTVRESARLQSFPDYYYFTGNKTSQYTQVGNAVPVLLAKSIGVQIKKYLNNNKKF